MSILTLSDQKFCVLAAAHRIMASRFPELFATAPGTGHPEIDREARAPIAQLPSCRHASTMLRCAGALPLAPWRPEESGERIRPESAKCRPVDDSSKRNEPDRSSRFPQPD